MPNFKLFKSDIMVNQIKTFPGHALALELGDSFTEADADAISQLFEEKLNMGADEVNMLILVKDISILKHISLKGFFKGEIWGMKYFGRIGHCAIVAHSGIIENIVKIEGKILRLFSHALEERYFDISQMDEAMAFITPE